jgi:hypothetical protein
MKKLDIAIAYRIFPGVSKNPFFHADDKLQLASACVRSLKLALTDVSFKIFAILDGCPESYETLFNKTFRPEELEIIKCNKVGNRETFKKQMEILLAQIEAEVVFFAEDDYLYVPGAFAKMVRFLRDFPDADFVTPYDHLDYYTLNFHEYKSKIVSKADHHWRNVSTTCLTFAVRQSALPTARRALLLYADGRSDTSVWLCVTKFNLFNPYKYFKFLVSHFYFFTVLTECWKYGWREIVFTKKHLLFSPVPSLATHAESTCLAPNIDWWAHIPKIKDIQD